MSKRYTTVAVTLHWLIALAILGLIPMGWWMADAIKSTDPAVRSQAASVFQLHKSIGLTVLALSLARLVWRLTLKPPPLPEGMPAWERFLAHGVQWAFYVIMIALPFTGWVYVSTGYSAELGQWVKIPTLYFGTFQVPHLPIAHAPEAQRIAASQGSMSAHSALAWGAIVLTGLHVAGALKHHFVAKDDTLLRMTPRVATVFLVGAAVAGVALAWPRPRAAVAESAPPVAAAPVLAETPAAVVTPEPAGAVEPEPAPAAAAGPQAPPPVWTVDPARSRIAFAGRHDGNPFEGTFERWTADIRFDPNAPSASKAVVTIETGSARTGDRFQETTLAEPEWFDPRTHPTARFETTAIRADGPGRYVAQGRLVIKNKAVPVTMPFTLKIAGARATMQAKLTLDRSAFDLGMASDPNFGWVSKDIAVTLTVEATRAP